VILKLQGGPKSDEIWHILRLHPQTVCSHARTRQNIVILKKNVLSTDGCSTCNATFRELWRTNPRDSRATLLFLKTNRLGHVLFPFATVPTVLALLVYCWLWLLHMCFWRLVDCWYSLGRLVMIATPMVISLFCGQAWLYVSTWTSMRLAPVRCRVLLHSLLATDDANCQRTRHQIFHIFGLHSQTFCSLCPNSVEYGNSKTTTLLPSAKCTCRLFQGRTGCGGRPSGWHNIVTCQLLVVTTLWVQKTAPFSFEHNFCKYTVWF